jgi:hypothetical protein
MDVLLSVKDYLGGFYEGREYCLYFGSGGCCVFCCDGMQSLDGRSVCCTLIIFCFCLVEVLKKPVCDPEEERKRRYFCSRFEKKKKKKKKKKMTFH